MSTIVHFSALLQAALCGAKGQLQLTADPKLVSCSRCKQAVRTESWFGAHLWLVEAQEEHRKHGSFSPEHLQQLRAIYLEKLRAHAKRKQEEAADAQEWLRKAEAEAAETEPCECAKGFTPERWAQLKLVGHQPDYDEAGKERSDVRLELRNCDKCGSTKAKQAPVSPTYPGSYQSALARSRRVLKVAGVPLAKKHGRYSPFGQTQTWEPGVRLSRVGLSSCISLTSVLSTYSSSTDEERRALERRALELLRADGLPFDHRGWLECES
jgi:hypothetical protein